jgi:hypothetical protein
MSIQSVEDAKISDDSVEESEYKGNITVGKDILELLSSSMYVNPLTIYREYVQNAIDSIDDAVEHGLLASTSDGRIEIALDHIGRRAVVRDNGLGLDEDQFVGRMTAFGGSKKRGTSARGFRGVGRLAGLGYCQELIFRSRKHAGANIVEVKWDCRNLKRLLADPGYEGSLEDIVRKIVTVRKFSDLEEGSHFFEVEIIKPKRLGNDILLNEIEIENYLSQVGPCPFRPEFRFAEQIRQIINTAGVREYNLYLNGSDEPIYRPYTDTFAYTDTKMGTAKNIQEISINGLDGAVAAVGWILRHDYQGALPHGLGMRGLRVRVGNIQVGNERILSRIFQEERFCSWTIGEVHVLDQQIQPNGRRDNFEPSNHLSNLKTYLMPFALGIARECRTSSQIRNRIKIFEIGENKVLEKIEVLEQGAISRRMVNTLKKEIGTLLGEIENAAKFDLFADGEQVKLNARVNELEDRMKNNSDQSTGDGYLASLSKSKQTAYREMIDLIFECSANKLFAKSLVDRILKRISKS